MMTRGLLAASCCVALFGAGYTATWANEPLDDEQGVALLSTKRGGFGFVGLSRDEYGRTPGDPMEQFAPTALTGSEISSMFGNFCLQQPFDYTAYETAIVANTDFAPEVADISEASLANPLFGRSERAATQITQHVSRYGISGFWAGENAEDLEGRLFLQFSGALVMTGPFKSKDTYAPQCNLTLRVEGMTSGTELLDGIAARVPDFSSEKRREKRRYAEETWTGPDINGRIPRIIATVRGFHRSQQTVHLTLQLLPEGKRK